MGVIARLLGVRNRWPRLLNRAVDYVADHPTGVLGRLAALRYRLPADVENVGVSVAGERAIRVLIAPVNYSSQGRMWAAALERADPDISARNMAVDVPGGFAFPANLVVPVPVYQVSRSWQERQLSALSSFTHVLIEAEEPLLGRYFGRSVAREVEVVRAFGADVAFMCHGTDIRLPSRHAELTPWSPYRDPTLYSTRLESLALAHRALIDRSGLPTFVSTPDLLADVPQAIWCPVVVDLGAWATTDLSRRRPGPLRVVHAPTSSLMKGTSLIEPVLRRLEAQGAIEYSPIRGVPSAQMPAVFAQADVVLDQFRLGSYGVAACEAMAAGRVVVGHIPRDVRETVQRATGASLPIVEATPDSLESVLLGLIDGAQRLAERGHAGMTFVKNVHDGRMSSRLLLDNWLRPSGNHSETR